MDVTIMSRATADKQADFGLSAQLDAFNAPSERQQGEARSFVTFFGGESAL